MKKSRFSQNLITFLFNSHLLPHTVAEPTFKYLFRGNIGRKIPLEFGKMAGLVYFVISGQVRIQLEWRDDQKKNIVKLKDTECSDEDEAEVVIFMYHLPHFNNICERVTVTSRPRQPHST